MGFVGEMKLAKMLGGGVDIWETPRKLISTRQNGLNREAVNHGKSK